MIESIKVLIESIKAHWLFLLMIIPAGTIVITLATFATISMLLISLPSDYFTRKKHGSRIKNPILRLFLYFLKNVCGIVFLGVGFILLFMPGPGVLSLLVGVILCEFPGKKRIERKIIERPLVLSTINRIRARYNRPLIVLDD